MLSQELIAPDTSGSPPVYTLPAYHVSLNEQFSCQALDCNVHDRYIVNIETGDRKCRLLSDCGHQGINAEQAR